MAKGPISPEPDHSVGRRAVLDDFDREPGAARGAVQPTFRRRPAIADEDRDGTDALSVHDDGGEYRRRAKPVRVRRGRIDPKTLKRIVHGLRVGWPYLLALVCVGVAYNYAVTDPAFALSSLQQVEMLGGQHISRAQVAGVFAADLGRNVFFVPMDARQRAIERIAWVKSASVLRILPNQIQVRVSEREPVAFARVGSHLQLIDADGVLLDRPQSAKFDFPVVKGFHSAQDGVSAIEQRRRQMQTYLALVQELDSDGGHHSLDISEVNLSDADDIQASVTPPGSSSELLLHLGNHDYLRRYKLFLAHVQEWQHLYPRLASVDLRYDGQAIIRQQ